MRWIRCAVAGLVAVVVACASAQTWFTDDFSAGASPLWSNDIGSWAAEAGAYRANAPGNFPNAHSALPFDLTDCSLEVDVHAAEDGGVWLRSAPRPGTAVGRTGVLLVFARGALYWHIIPDGNGYGAALGSTGGVFTPGVTDLHLRVEVVGQTYAAYLNGSPTPTTSVTTDAFSSGQAALYSYARQTYDNVRLEGRPTLVLSAPAFRTPDRFECRVTGPSEAGFVLEATADFAGWTQVFTGELTDGTATVTLVVPLEQRYQFYRAVLR